MQEIKEFSIYVIVVVLFYTGLELHGVWYVSLLGIALRLPVWVFTISGIKSYYKNKEIRLRK